MRFRWRWLLGGGYLLLVVLFIVIAIYVSPCSQEYFGCLGRMFALLLLVLPWTLPVLADVQIPWPYDLRVFLGLGIGLNYLILCRIGTTIDRDGIASSAFRRLMRSIGIGLAIIIAMIPLGKRYHSAQSRRQELKETRGLGFQLYAPTFLPSGYRLFSAGPGPKWAYAKYYELTYLSGGNNPGDPPPFTIYQFERPPGYYPPEDCGQFVLLSKPEMIELPCQLVDESEGNKIYYDKGENSNIYGWFMAKGDVLVTLRTTTSVPKEVSLDKGVLLHVLKSLQEVSPEDLAALKDAFKVR